MPRELEDLYSGRLFTGVIKGPGGFNTETQNRTPGVDSDTRSLVAKLGKKCEQVQFQAWTETLPAQNYNYFLEVAAVVRERVEDLKGLAQEGITIHSQQMINSLKETLAEETDEEEIKKIRSKIKKQQQRKYFSHNADSNPIYQALTSPPDILEGGFVRAEPDWQPLAELFSEADRLFDTNLVDEFANIGETYYGSGVVDGKIKFLVETALILSRIVENKTNHNIPPTFEVVPNKWISNQVQFDGILYKNNDGVALPDLYEKWRGGTLPWWVIETKIDYRARFLFGDRIGRRPHNRHIEEMQIKLASLVDVNGGNFRLPEGILYVYERGTEEPVFHNIPLDHPFLSQWRMGILISLDRADLSPEERDKSYKLLSMIQCRMDELAEKENTRKVLGNNNQQGAVPVPFAEFAPLVSEKVPNPVKTEEGKKKSFRFPLQAIEKMMDKARLNTIAVTELGLTGSSLEKVSLLLDSLTQACGDDEELKILSSKTPKFSAWIESLQNDQTTHSLPPTFITPTGDLQPYITTDGTYLGDYTNINLKSFIEIFGSQLWIYFRQNHTLNTVARREFKKLLLIADRLKDRSTILMLGEPDKNGVRQFLGGALKKKGAIET